MAWRDLLSRDEESPALPWLGDGLLRLGVREWYISPPLPPEHGWYVFKLKGRSASSPRPAEPRYDILRNQVVGYLVGDHVVPDGGDAEIDWQDIPACGLRVYLVPDGIDRFSRVVAGSAYEGGPLVFQAQEMPLGPEAEVLEAYLDHRSSVADIKGVVPALDAAFRLESWRRNEVERRRLEAERRRLEEQARLEREARRRELVERLGDGAGRREMAHVDFSEAARAALAVGGAELLDVRRGTMRGEHVVRYRLDHRRFECVCDERLHIIDSGICLRDEYTGERGDTRFTLESLPAVVRQAERERRLVVFRHV